LKKGGHKNLLNLLFLDGRTFSDWKNKKVKIQSLRQIYDLAKLCPTSANSSPLRVIFVVSAGAKKKLIPCLTKGNIEKTKLAPVTAIFSCDLKFYKYMPRLYPHVDMHSGFAKDSEKAKKASHFNATLQAGYFILAARTLGFDCGPMGGFDNKKVDRVFFAKKNFESILLCNIGFGESKNLKPRNPRLGFKDACQII
jgi:3-hydroxypropanoate dehydrogenase|tara:strand:+ start:3246 stop:3836 length:591 start_codon:yes stop_codon:yes gene_type:complete